MDDDDQIGYAFTEKGLLFAIEVHQKLLDGWSLQQVAAFYGYDVELIQVLLAAFYHAADQTSTDLGIHVPDTIEGLD